MLLKKFIESIVVVMILTISKTYPDFFKKDI